MYRSIARILFVCLCVITFCVAGFSQAHSLAAANSEIAPTPSPTTGKVDITFEITFDDTWIPGSDTIGCEVTLSVEGETTTFREIGALAGTRTGNHATCVVSMYYSWVLQQAGSDTLNLTYDVGVPPEISTSLTLPYRANTQSASMPVPASGTPTHITVEVVL